MRVLLATNQQLSYELEGFVETDVEVQQFLNKKEKVQTIKQMAENQLSTVLAEAQAKKEEIQKAAAMTQYLATQAAMERTE